MSRHPRSKGSHNGTDPTDAGDAAVGYGRPPLHSRFHKGKSGNPLGRPPKAAAGPHGPQQSKSHLDIMNATLLEPVTYHANGTSKLISKAEAVQRTQERLALVHGRVMAARDLKHDLLALDAQRQAEIEEDHAYWHCYIEQQARQRQRSTASSSSRDFWIEPEDIIFIPGRKVRTRGPVTAQDIPAMLQLQKLQWACFVSGLQGQLAARNEEDPKPDQALFLSELLWSSINSVLTTKMATQSEAYRKTVEDRALAERMLCRSRSFLAQEAKRCWAALDMRPPKIFPTPGVIKALHPLQRRIISAILADPITALMYRTMRDAHPRGSYRRRRAS